MKQTKLREPILYTSLWVVIIIGLVLFDNYYAPINLDKMGYVLGMTVIFLFICVLIYALIGWIVALTKRADRHETRDMKKYTLEKIAMIDKHIAELQEEKEELLYSYED